MKFLATSCTFFLFYSIFSRVSCLGLLISWYSAAPPWWQPGIFSIKSGSSSCIQGKHINEKNYNVTTWCLYFTFRSNVNLWIKNRFYHLRDTQKLSGFKPMLCILVELQNLWWWYRTCHKEESCGPDINNASRNSNE